MSAPTPPTSLPEFFETTIEKIVTGGAGLGRCEGLAAFVPLTAPGDRVRARVVRRKRGFVEAELTEVLAPVADRQAAPCPHFGTCGGCDFQHLAAVAQRAAKAAIVADCFQRLGGMDVAPILEPPEPAGPELGYRNRIRLVADATGRYGLVRRGSQQVVPLDVCLQMPPVFNETILPWLRQLPPLEQIVVRLDGAGGFLISAFGLPNRLRFLKIQLRKLPEGEPPLPGCVGVLYNNLPAWGHDYLLVRVAGKTFRVGANSFFQSNYAEAAAVVATARAWLDQARPAGGLLADLYCGVGLFGIALADRFERIAAVESEPHAVRDARNNAAHDKGLVARAAAGANPPPFEVQQKSVAAALAEWAAEPAADWPEACVFLDPPRTGIEEGASASLERLAPREILYLSCDPATLARDVASLVKGGYELRRLRLFDMFPQTAHVETLALLHRSG